MTDIFKSILGFVAILLVGLVGVTVSEFMKSQNTSAIVTTVDNTSYKR